MNNSHPINPDRTSGTNTPYWLASAEPIVFSPLNEERETEVLVVGGGLAGITTAYCLAKAGKKVILVEDGFIGSGESGRTTAHITYALDDRYYDLEKFYGTEKTKIIADSHRAAIDFIEHRVIEEEIACNFERVDGYLFLDPTDREENLDEEFEVTQRLELPTELLEEIPYFEKSTKRGRSIKFPRQAQFHILEYLRGLSYAIFRNGGEIFTQSKAEDITKDGARVNGYRVKATHVVVATNTPVNDRFTMHTKQWAYRTYVIAAKIPKNTLPHALWWDTGNMESKWVTKPYHYVRVEPFDMSYDLLISGGEDHKTGQAEEENYPEESRYEDLLAWTQLHFPYFDEVEYRWSGQVMEPVDCIAFLGKNPGDDNIYIITGDSGNGMTHCTLGALLVSDLIQGKPNVWEEVYNPSRITLKTADDYMAEVGNMTYKMIKDWVLTELDSTSELSPGQGGILTRGLQKIAVYRDLDGKLQSCSAVCTHLGGVLHWNNEEKSFDCPLHGSRFTPEGKIINGPAQKDLEKLHLEDE